MLSDIDAAEEVLHVCSLHPDAPAAGDRVSSCLYLLPDLPPVQQDVTEGVLGENVSGNRLQQTLQHCGQTAQSRAAQSHVLYLVITHCTQLWPHQVLCHHLCTGTWRSQAAVESKWDPKKIDQSKTGIDELFFTVCRGTFNIVNRTSTMWHTSRTGR